MTAAWFCVAMLGGALLGEAGYWVGVTLDDLMVARAWKRRADEGSST